MATEVKRQPQAQEKRPQQPARRRRRGNRVPLVLVIILLVLALLMGGLGGFAVARKTDRSRNELERVQERNRQLENILTAIGFNEGADDPETWVNSYEDDGLSAITSDGDDGDVSLWDDQSVVSGLMSEEQDPVVVAEFDGGELLSSEFIPAYNDALSTAIFGGVNAEDAGGALLQDVLSQQVGEKLKLVEAEKQGLNTLTDAEAAEAEAVAKAEFEETLAMAVEAVSEEGKTAEENRAAAEQYLQESEGITLDSLIQGQRRAALEKKFHDFVVKDVDVTDEEIQAHYDELLAQQKQDFDNVPDDFFFSHLNNTVVVYNPEGFRAVRDVLIAFDNPSDGDTAGDILDQLSEVDPSALGENYDALNEQLASLYAPLEAKAQEAVDKLNGGAAFTQLMDEYGCSDYLKSEPLRSQGYYISSESTLISDEYVQGATMLEQPGQVSVPLRSAQGLHLVEYIGDVTPGPVPLEECREAVRQSVLQQKQNEYYDQYISDLLDNAHVKYYPERLQ